MTYTTSSLWGPDSTPKAIMRLILITCVVAIVSALIDPLFTHIFGVPGPQTWLSLSWYGIHNYLLWQPLTYLFVESTGSYGLSLFFLIGLAFNMYILWIMGSTVLDVVGTRPFLKLYFLSGIGAGLLALAAMYASGRYSILAGSLPSILAVITVWTMLHPNVDLLLFFLFPCKAKWLLAGLLGAIFLVNASQLNWVSMTLYLSGAFIGYLYAVLAWELQSPFAWTHRFDSFLSSLGKKLRRRKKDPRENERKAKIYDIKTGKPVDDDEHFIDAMLTKISQQGEKSLTWRERRRMQSISARKSKENK